MYIRYVHAGLSANVGWKWSTKNIFKVYKTLNCFCIKCHFYPSVQFSIFEGNALRKSFMFSTHPQQWGQDNVQA